MLWLFVFLLPFAVNGVFTPAPQTTTDPSGSNGSNDVQHLRQLIADEKSERMRLQAEVEQLKTIVKNLTARVEHTPHGSIVHSNCEYNAFRVQLTHDLGIVRRGSRILYDHVDLNIGRGYDPKQSIFTAPCDGAYLFSISIGNHARFGGITIKQNGHAIEFAFAGFSSGWEMAGVTTIAMLSKGDKVWVEGEDYIGGSYSGDPTHLHTGFSGTLIHAN